MFSRRYGIVALAVILVSVLVYEFLLPLVMGHANTKPKPVSVIPVRTVSVIKRDMHIPIRAVGTVFPYQSVHVKSRIDSQITDVAFQSGDFVKNGDLLFILDDRIIKAQLNQAKSNIQRDLAQVENLRKKYDRSKKLIQTNAISQEALEDAQAAVDLQMAALSADQAAFENLQIQLDFTRIKAPISGKTGTVQVTVGNTVKTTDSIPLVTINQIHPILVQASLPQHQFWDVRDAMGRGAIQVTVQREENQPCLMGELAYIDNTIDNGSGTFIVRAVFENKNEVLWPGMLTNLVLGIGIDKEVLTIPDVAVQTGPSGQFVYRIDHETAQKAVVEVKRIQESTAIIAGGLEEGEQIVIDGIMDLKEGAKVKITSEKKEP